MNHPAREEWAPFIYGESARDDRRRLEAHLQNCSECRALVEEWRQSSRQLDRWKLPRRRVPLDWLAPALRLAAASVLVLGLGFGIGRFTAGSNDLEKLRVRLEPQIRESLRQEIAQMVREEASHSASATLAAANDHTEKLLAAFNTIQETRRSEDLERLYVAIKKQLDTVAINTEKEFVQLAGYTRPADSSSSPQR